MKWSLDLPKIQSSIEFGYADSLIFAGSCFSQNIQQKAERAGFNAKDLPFGTLFHPVILSNLLNQILGIEPTSARFFQRDNRFFSWNASTLFFGKTEEALLDSYSKAILEYHERISNAKVLIVTFGTAVGYSLESDKTIVANCHKMLPNLFTRRLFDIQEMEKSWRITIAALKELNPSLSIIFTVSPVRHTKEGLVENNRSKARLIQLAENLSTTNGVEYFPSYELMMDVLRDYRFYAKDMIHPNSQAIDEIWSYFLETYCTEQTRKTVEEVARLKAFFDHVPLLENPMDTHLARMKGRKDTLLAENPGMIWK